MEEQHTLLYVWGFDINLSEIDIFNFFNYDVETSLVSVKIERDEFGNSLQRALLMYRDREYALVAMKTLNQTRLRINPIQISLDSFPQAIPETLLYPRAESLAPWQTSSSQLNLGAHASMPWPSSASQQYPRAESLAPWQTSSSQLNLGAHASMPWPSSASQQYPRAESLAPWQTSSSQLNLGAHASMPWPSSASQQYPRAESLAPWQTLSSQLNNEMRDVYVGNLSTTTTDEQLRIVFSVYGHVDQASVVKSADGASRGFGFVKFKHGDSAVKAIDHLNGKNFEGRAWHVHNKYKKSLRQQEIKEGFERGVTCYVSNFRYDLNEAGLRDLFLQYGEVSSCKIRRFPDSGMSRGSGFVEFVTPQAALAATDLNGKVVDGRSINVSIARSKVVDMAGQGSRSQAL